MATTASSATPNYHLTSEGSENLEERTAILKEIVDAETHYVQQLNTLVELFLLPLREAVLSMQPILTQEEIRTIFSTCEVILSLNSKLQNDLVIRHQKWPSEQIVGLSFLEMSPYLKLYTQYIQNFNIAVTTMSECSRRQPAFASFLETCQSNLRCEGQSIFAYLLMPLKQILHYLKVLDALLNNTNEKHEDYDNILRALGKIRNIAINIGEKLNEAEALEDVWTLQQQMRGGLGSLLEPHRAIIRAGWLKKQGKLNLKTCWFILFNDILICTLPIEGGNSKHKYQFRWRLPLAGCTVEDIADDTPEGQAGGGHGFRVNSLRKNYNLYAFSEPEKQEWLQDLRAYIIECSRKKDRGGDGTGEGGGERQPAVSVGDFLVGKMNQGDEEEETALIGSERAKKVDDGRPKWSVRYPPKLENQHKEFDNNVTALCQRPKNKHVHRLGLALSFIFSAELILAIPYLSFMCGIDGMGAEMTWMATMAILVVAFMKRFIYRKRPYVEGRAKKLKADQGTSFPCSTTCNAVMLCFSLAYLRKYFAPSQVIAWWAPIIPIILVIPPLFARIHLGVVHPSDAISGAMVGFVLCFCVAALYKIRILNCASCAFAACYSYSTVPTTGENFGKITTTAMIPVLIIFPLVAIALIIICLRKPIEMFPRIHTFFGCVFPMVMFKLLYLCPSLNSGLSIEEPNYAKWWIGLIIGVIVFAVVVVVSHLTMRGPRYDFKWRLLGFVIIYLLIFFSLFSWRLTYTRQSNYLPPPMWTTNPFDPPYI